LTVKKKRKKRPPKEGGGERGDRVTLAEGWGKEIPTEEKRRIGRKHGGSRKKKRMRKRGEK